MPFNPSDYRLFDAIGKGSYGQVYRAMDAGGKIVAVKMVDVEQGDVNDTILEIDLLRKLKHENVLQLIEVGIVDSTVWLCTEYCAGSSLHRILKTNGPPSEASAAYVVYSLLKALNHIHNLKIVHRDIKPANVFIDGQATVKLGDFGVSAQLTDSKPMRDTFIGTPFWMAPEVISQSFYSAPADIWAVGVIAIELVTGETPWAKFKPTQAMMKIVQEDAPILARSGCPRPGLLSVYYVSLVGQCMVKDPLKRASAEELVNQKWLTRYENPPREFRLLVREQVARHPPLGGYCRRVKPSSKAQNNGTWIFDPTVKIESRPPLATTAIQNTSEYIYYFDYAFKAVEDRSLRSDCRIRIERMRLTLRSLDASLSGLGKTLLEEALVAESIKAPDLWIDQVFYNVEKRSVKADVKKKIQLVRLSLREVERVFPGFSRAFVQEVQGRIKHSKSQSSTPQDGNGNRNGNTDSPPPG